MFKTYKKQQDRGERKNKKNTHNHNMALQGSKVKLSSCTSENVEELNVSSCTLAMDHMDIPKLWFKFVPYNHFELFSTLKI